MFQRFEYISLNGRSPGRLLVWPGLFFIALGLFVLLFPFFFIFLLSFSSFLIGFSLLVAAFKSSSIGNSSGGWFQSSASAHTYEPKVEILPKE